MTNDSKNHIALGVLLHTLDEAGFRFRTQGADGDVYVPAEEIASDLRHGDMAEMLTWDADWNGDTMTISVVAPEDAVESPGALIEFHALRSSDSIANREL